MNEKDLSEAKNPDLRGSLTALRRASEMARQTAIQTETNLVIFEGGRILHISAQTLREQAQARTASHS